MRYTLCYPCPRAISLQSGLLRLTMIVLVLAVAGAAAAAEGTTGADDSSLDFGQGYDWLGISYVLVPAVQGEADLDAGGSLRSTHTQLRLGVMTTAFDGLIGASLSFNHIDYSFTNAAAFGGQAPWDRVRSVDFAIPVLGRLAPQWTYLVVPSIGLYGEEGASSSDSRTYGVVVGVGYSVEPERRIGIGLGAYDRLDKSKLFPFISFSWKLNDRMRLGNPLRAGPTGAAGIELAYRFNDRLEGGIGFARRNLRFRLDNEGPAPGGSGLQSGRLFFARLTHEIASQVKLGLHLGLLGQGYIEQRNQDEVLLGSDDHDIAPLVALSLDGRF